MSCALLLALLAAGDAPAIQGDYLEARTCDVWTGPCFANGDINVKGRQAVAGWSVDRGAWDGVSLDGLKVAAAILADGTIGTDGEGEIKAVLYVDAKATESQAAALAAMARSLAPRYLAKAGAPVRAEIAFERKGVEAVLRVSDVAVVRTKAFCPCDAICCNEEQFFPAMSGATQIECAKTVEHAFSGAGLDSRWSDPDKRSAMVGRFAR